MDENVMMDDPFDPDQYGVQSAPGMPNEYTNVPRRPLSKEMQEQLNQSMTVPPPAPPIRVFGGYGQDEGYRRPSQGERYLGASGPVQIRGYAEQPQSQEDQARYEGQFGLAIQDRMQHIHQVVQQAVNNDLMYHTDRFGRRQPSARLQEILRQSYSAMGELGQFHQRGGPGGKNFLEPQTQFSTPQMNQLAQLDKAEAEWQAKARSEEIKPDEFDQVMHQIDQARAQIKAKAIPQGPSPQEKLNMGVQYHAQSKQWFSYEPKTDTWKPVKPPTDKDTPKTFADLPPDKRLAQFHAWKKDNPGGTSQEFLAEIKELETAMAPQGAPQGGPGPMPGMPPGAVPGGPPGVPAQPPGQPVPLPLGPPMSREKWQHAYHVVTKSIDDIVAEDHKEKHRKREEGQPAYEPRINPNQVDWAKIQALEDAGLIPPGNRGAQLEGAPRRTGYEHYLEMHKKRATPPGAAMPGGLGNAPTGPFAKVASMAAQKGDTATPHFVGVAEGLIKKHGDIDHMSRPERWEYIQALKQIKKYVPGIEIPDEAKYGIDDAVKKRNSQNWLDEQMQGLKE